MDMIDVEIQEELELLKQKTLASYILGVIMINQSVKDIKETKELADELARQLNSEEIITSDIDLHNVHLRKLKRIILGYLASKFIQISKDDSKLLTTISNEILEYFDWPELV